MRFEIFEKSNSLGAFDAKFNPSSDNIILRRFIGHPFKNGKEYDFIGELNIYKKLKFNSQNYTDNELIFCRC